MERTHEPTRAPELVMEIKPKGSRKRRGNAETRFSASQMLRVLNVSRSKFNEPLLKMVEKLLKESHAMSVGTDLLWLAVFLSSDKEEWEDNEKEKQIPFLGGSYPTHYAVTREEHDRLGQLKDEIIQVIEPLLKPRPGTRVLDHLRCLVQKINAIGLQPVWYLEPAEAEWKLIQGSKVITKGYRVSQLGPGRGILKIGGQKWAVRHAFDDRQVETAKENLVDYFRRAYYAVIITALEDGSFSRLGHCQKCKKFFVGQRRGVKYCSEECMKLADRNRAVTVRVPRWRDRQREFRD